MKWPTVLTIKTKHLYNTFPSPLSARGTSWAETNKWALQTNNVHRKQQQKQQQQQQQQHKRTNDEIVYHFHTICLLIIVVANLTIYLYKTVESS